MKRIVILIITIGLFLVGCSSEAANDDDAKSNSTNGIVEEFDSTKERVYSTSWDGIPIIVKQRNTNEIPMKQKS
jgi:PBP1b-binding outer membrane lipoprotein LpoB